MKIITQLIVIVFLLNSCIEDSRNKIVINQNVEYEVAENIIDTISQSKQFCAYRQETRAEIEYYQNDTLIYNSIDSINFMNLSSLWEYKGDTLIIIGSFGSTRTSQFGFQINKTRSGLSSAYVYTRGHLMPNYSATKDGDLDFNLLVPLNKWNCILSKIPTQNEYGKFIFGYIELESKDFYETNKYENGEEVIETRKKVKSKMKIYFKSINC